MSHDNKIKKTSVREKQNYVIKVTPVYLVGPILWVVVRLVVFKVEKRTFVDWLRYDWVWTVASYVPLVPYLNPSILQLCSPS